MSTKQPTTDEIRDFVIAGHGNFEKVQQLLAAQPALLNLAHVWRPGDTETALQGAAHVGNRPIAEYLLAQGAPLDICTAAMLGRRKDVQAFLQENASSSQAHGAHGISLLTHAAISGDVELVEELYRDGASSGATMALNLAVDIGHFEVARWLLENAQPDLEWKNFRGKTALELAIESGNQAIEELLRSHDARA